MSEPRPRFFGLTLERLAGALGAEAKADYKAQRLYRWSYGLNRSDFDGPAQLSREFRAKLPQVLDFSLPEVLKVHQSTDGTLKLLCGLGGGESVETVVIPYKGRLTLCVSSEVGCNMACGFCYTAKQKLKRRLETWEIVGQYVQASRRLGPGQKLANVVFMGMGEPLDNPDAVFEAVEILHSHWGCNVGKRRISVSTSGIVPLIPRVTAAGVRLSVSLNGANDEVRSRLMPINRRWPLKELLEACREHCRVSGDMVNFEYVLLKGVTDSLRDARELHRLTRDLPCAISLIPFNEHPDSGFLRPEDADVARFQKELMDLGTQALLRRTMGRDIYAACGQLTTAAGSGNC